MSTICEGKYIRLVDDNGWEFAERTSTGGVVIIVAVTEDGKLLLVEQYRPPVGASVIELPAGLVGDAVQNEAMAEAAARELEEETGYKATSVQYLTEGPPSPGIISEIVTYFLAEGLKKVSKGGGVEDEGEDITVHEVSLNKAAEWLRTAAGQEGRMVDPKVYGALYFTQ